MKYLLDTCLLSELVRPAPHPAVLDWMGERSSSDLYVSALTLAELERGIVRLPASRRRNELTAWLATRVRHFDRIFRLMRFAGVI